LPLLVPPVARVAGGGLRGGLRKELNEIQATVVRRLFVLAKLVHLTHLRIGEYVALIAATDVTGQYGVGVLLETCLADKLAFVERTRRLLREIAETKAAERKELAHLERGSDRYITLHRIAAVAVQCGFL